MHNFSQMTRRSTLKILGLGAAASLLPLTERASAQAPPLSDADIFNFALNLEYLETEYYLRGTSGRGLADSEAGPDPGSVHGGKMVPWKNKDLREFMEEVAANELAHVRFYRKVLGDGAVSRPELDIAGGFAAAAKAAGLGDNFDPFADEMSFLLGGMLMEDVGITAYNGAAPLIQSKTNLQAAAGILAVEAHHMGMIRSQLYSMGRKARHAANAISDARDMLDGPADVEQGLEVNGKANFVPSDADGKAFTRTPQQVLRIVYLAGRDGVASGGMYPRGMNGTIRMT